MVSPIVQRTAETLTSLGLLGVDTPQSAPVTHPPRRVKTMAIAAGIQAQGGGSASEHPPPIAALHVLRPRLAPALVGVAALGGCVTIGMIDPTGGPVLCPFRAATGLYCPGCGSTRMLHHVFTGRFDLAIGDNPVALLMLPLLLWWGFVGLTAWAGGPRWTQPRFTASQTWALAACVGLFWILRNLPISPFTLLAPG